MPVTVTTAQGFTWSTKFQTFVSRTVHCSSSLNPVLEFWIGPGLNWYWKVCTLTPSTGNEGVFVHSKPQGTPYIPLTKAEPSQPTPAISVLHMQALHRTQRYSALTALQIQHAFLLIHWVLGKVHVTGHCWSNPVQSNVNTSQLHSDGAFSSQLKSWNFNINKGNGFQCPSGCCLSLWETQRQRELKKGQMTRLTSEDSAAIDDDEKEFSDSISSLSLSPRSLLIP